ncbi:MAG: TerB family tellurite resistance protein [Polyangiaceae bacterium]|nr:TerB family tellurite resistance protein [Polyangiaceae bacterium]MCW5791324.1 TerB family tellurite resistance protein [Polyangiaceae bacterium]
MSSSTLPRESFLAIAAVVAADGLLKQDESKALARAVSAYGLSPEDAEAVTSAATERVELASIDLSELDGWQQAVTYAVASWLAQVDGVVNAAELSTLRQLGEQLGLPRPKLEAARSAAYDIAALPRDQRPDKYDFSGLEARLAEKLPALHRASLPPSVR